MSPETNTAKRAQIYKGALGGEPRGTPNDNRTPKLKQPFDPKLFLATVGAGKTIADYSEKQVVFSQGDRADAIFYIQRGKTKLTVVSRAGKEAVIGILGPGNFLGEGCLAGQPCRMASATSMSNCSILRLEKLAMIRVLHEEPAFSEFFLTHVLSREHAD